MTNASEAARTYIARGWQPVPVPPGSKNPGFLEWEKFTCTTDDVPRWFNERGNIGLILGAPSHGLVDVDCDVDEAVQLARVYLPHTGLRSGRPGNPDSHYWYVVDPPDTKLKKFQYLLDKKEVTLIEFRATGGQTLSPPSIHDEDRDVYTWHEFAEPAPIKAADLRRIVQKIAIGALIARFWPTPGRHNAGLAIGGLFLSTGWEEDEAAELVRRAAEVAGHDRPSDRERAVRDTYKNSANGRAVRGIPSLKDVFPQAITDRLVLWCRESSPNPDFWKHGKKRTTTNGYASDGNGVPLETIQLNNTQLRDPVDLAVAALQQHNTPPTLFRWGEGLARIHHDAGNRPIVQLVTRTALKERLTRCADFIRVTKKKEEWVQTAVSPTQELAESILALSTWPFPALVGITECPCLRPDGTVITIPGYDATTALFYAPAPGLTLPAIPENPSQEDARAALRYVLDELLVDFPFVEQADRANMLACLLTPIVRSAIIGNVPLCLLDKPSPGSGATLLSDMVGIIATGQNAAKQTAPDGRYAEEEWRKKLTSIVLSGVSVVVFDNLENELFSGTFSSILTASVWSDRLLGQHLHVTVPVRQTWIATANNIGLRGDFARRTYKIRIDSKTERPWQRNGFRHADLLSWARVHRGELLSALLTIARAWYAAGQPPAKTPTLGNFEQWTRIVGGMLFYAGAEGFLQNLEDLYSFVDDEGPQWSAFLQIWHEEVRDQAVTVKELAGFAITKPRIFEALPDSIDWDEKKPESSRKKLGKALLKRAFRVYSGYRLERAKNDGHAKVAQWLVRELAGFAGFDGAYICSEKKEEEARKSHSEGSSEQTPPNPANPATTDLFDWETGEPSAMPEDEGEVKL